MALTMCYQHAYQPLSSLNELKAPCNYSLDTAEIFSHTTHIGLMFHTYFPLDEQGLQHLRNNPKLSTPDKGFKPRLSQCELSLLITTPVACVVLHYCFSDQVDQQICISFDENLHIEYLYIDQQKLLK